jgi:hypothetical protein
MISRYVAIRTMSSSGMSAWFFVWQQPTSFFDVGGVRRAFGQKKAQPGHVQNLTLFTLN